MNFAPGVWWYSIPLFVTAIPAFIVWAPLSFLFLALGGGVLYFYRDPDRSPPPTGVVSPADGKVSVIREEGDRIRVGVFMNVWDVHVNRAPLGGVVENVEHVSGAHRPAFSKESDRNERVHLRFEDHTVTLVAGAFARRIHPYVEEGDTVDAGDRIGHISFGSRADVLLPPEYGTENLEVERGESVTAGETVIARAGDSVFTKTPASEGLPGGTSSEPAGIGMVDDPRSESDGAEPSDASESDHRSG